MSRRRHIDAVICWTSSSLGLNFASMCCQSTRRHCQDHSFVVAQLPMIAPQPAATTQVVREWCKLDVDEFAHDFAASNLFRSPPTGTDAAFELYDRTLRQLVDKHVPLTVHHVRLRRNARLYDADCRAARRTTRRLERLFRRRGTCDAREAWRSQFE
jgi:hypothetical protein